MSPEHAPRPRDKPPPSDPPPTSDGVSEPRPLIERLGLAAIATVLALMFGGVAASAWVGGEPFLAVMGAIGCLMTVWVGGMTRFRG